jgi:hypothetical protein
MEANDFGVSEFVGDEVTSRLDRTFYVVPHN